MITSEHCSYSASLTDNHFSVITISTLIKSILWLERELSEFSGLRFLGLADTRRLLSDYFEVRGVSQTHVGNDRFFNNNLYDVFLNF